MLDVHDGRADTQLRQIANDLIGIDDPRTADFLRIFGPMPKQLAFRDDQQFVGPQALVERCDGDAETLGPGQEAGKIFELCWSHAGTHQKLVKQFPAPGRLRCEQHARVGLIESEAQQRLCRILETCVCLQVGQRLGLKADLVFEVVPKNDAGLVVEAPIQLVMA